MKQHMSSHYSDTGQSGIQFGFHLSFQVAQFFPASLIPQRLLLEFSNMPL
jgi:hypothetical protein